VTATARWDRAIASDHPEDIAYLDGWRDALRALGDYHARVEAAGQAASAAPGPCQEPNCDGELHYAGTKDPTTNEDVEAGPCPEWS
jgi:hypothetical protein